MKNLGKEVEAFPTGIRLALLALAFLMLAWGMQAYSLLNWDHAVSLGIQNERFSDDPAETAWAFESWGVAMADMVWPLPLTVVALIGIFRRRFFGFAAGLMACAVGIYFPLFFAFQRWQTFRGTVVLALVLFSVPCLIAVIGLWANRDWFRDS